eukprot:gene26740-biopygen17274
MANSPHEEAVRDQHRAETEAAHPALDGIE